MKRKLFSIILVLCFIFLPISNVKALSYTPIKIGETKNLKVDKSMGIAAYESSNPYVLTINQKGIAKAKNLGFAVVTITTSKGIYQQTFKVVKNYPTIIYDDWENDVSLPKGITKKNLTLGTGATDTIALNRIEGPVTWSISNNKIASIKANGVRCEITAKKAGTAKIKAKANGKTYSCKLTVIKKGIKLSQKTITVEVGTKKKVIVSSADDLTAISYEPDIVDYNWGKSSGNKSPLYIKGLKAGVAYIDVKTKHTDELKTIKVIVKKKNTNIQKPESDTNSVSEYKKFRSEWITDEDYDIYWLYDYILLKDDFNSYKIYDIPAGGFEKGKIYNGTYDGHTIRIQYIGLLEISDSTYIVNSICINRQDLIDAGIILN